jgi:T5SS/PEP-CTERM-associated repeat protein
MPHFGKLLMRLHFRSRLAENLFLHQACTLLLVVALLTPGVVHASLWSGIGSDWFSSTSWTVFTDPGPPTSTENAIFPNSLSGIPLSVTNVQLSASTTIRSLSVQSPTTKQYTFTGANGAVLTATQLMDFGNSDFQALNVHTIASLRLNTPLVELYENAILSLNNSTVTTNSMRTVNNGRIDVNDGSSVQTLTYSLDNAAGELRVNSGGELRIAGDTTLVRGTTTINGGGQLNALSGVDLEYNGSAVLVFGDSHAVDNGVHLKATGGGDISAVSFIDVGNGVVGSLTVTGAGSTLAAAGSVSDWGAGSAGNATVTIADSGLATASQLRAGTGSAMFQGTVTSGGTLRTTSTFRMGGGSTIRQVSLNVDGGTLETTGLATFDDQADLHLLSGTVDFNGGATFNSGSRIDWTSGTLNLGASSTLLVDGGVFNRTNTNGFIFSNNTTTRIRNGGSFTTPSYFDLGTATLDMTGGGLTVGTTGGTISDWGGSGATTTATLTNSAVATYNSGLRMGVLGSGGSTNATISSGARLVSNDSLSTGGEAASNVTLNVTGGRVESDGAITLQRGTTTTVSAAGVIEGQNVVLGSNGGTTITTVTGSNSLLKSRGTLTAGRAGTSSLAISAGAKAESLGPTIIGELAGSSAVVAVSGAGSRLDVGSSLTIGGSGAGSLEIHPGGFVPVTNGVSVGVLGTLDLTGGTLETSIGQSITNNGLIRASDGSTIRSDIVNAGTLNLLDASTTRSVTLQANSQMTADNSTVGSLTQQPTADLKFTLRSASDFDNLAVTGAASLGGDVVVSLLGGFAPIAGTEFQVLIASSISGLPTFDFSAAPLGSGLAWGVALSPTSISLAIHSSGIAGDYNADGTVNAADYTVWRDNFGSTTVLPNDPSGGTIGVTQYNTWRSNFGSSNSGSAHATALSVPEPATLPLALLLFAALIRSRRRPQASPL